MWSQVNIVTFIIAIIMIIFILRGLAKDLSGETLFSSIISIINNGLFVFSFIISVYATKILILEKDSGRIWGKIFNAIPGSIQMFLSDAGILIYLIVTPIFLCILCIVLLYFRTFLDSYIKKVSNWMGGLIGKNE